MKYKSKGGKDIIYKGKIYRPVAGVVEIPFKIEHPDLEAVKAAKPTAAKGKAKNVNTSGS